MSSVTVQEGEKRVCWSRKRKGSALEEVVCTTDTKVRIMSFHGLPLRPFSNQNSGQHGPGPLEEDEPLNHLQFKILQILACFLPIPQIQHMTEECFQQTTKEMLQRSKSLGEECLDIIHALQREQKSRPEVNAMLSLLEGITGQGPSRLAGGNSATTKAIVVKPEKLHVDEDEKGSRHGKRGPPPRAHEKRMKSNFVRSTIMTRSRTTKNSGS